MTLRCYSSASSQKTIPSKLSSLPLELYKPNFMEEEDDTNLLEPLEEAGDAPQRLVDLLSDPLDDVKVDIVPASLVALGDAEAIETCVRVVRNRPIENAGLVRVIIKSGLERGEKLWSKIEEDVRKDLPEEQAWGTVSPQAVEEALERTLGNDATTKAAVSHIVQLHDLHRRLETFDLISPSAEAGPSNTSQSSKKPEHEEPAAADGMELDDPWAQADDEDDAADVDDPWESSSIRSAASNRSTKSLHLVSSPSNEDEMTPIILASFMADPLAESACTIAATGASRALTILFTKHHSELWPYRYGILKVVPPWIPPAELSATGILPRVTNDEEDVALPEPPTSLLDLMPDSYHLPLSTLPTAPRRKEGEVRQWYLSRIDMLDTLGLLDVQLAWIQHGASLGVTELDAVGEELSLLSRLVYDAHLSTPQQSQWSLSSWRSSNPEQIIQGYLSNATPGSIVDDIRRLVLPYLYVLESKAERAGEPHAELISNHLHDIILSLPLNLALPIFEASKATLPQSERVVKNDQIVARLALACLYGSNTRSDWSTMSAIFECLPVWDVSGGDPESDKEATATTLDSIATFVRPTRAGAHPPTAKDLFIFFAPLPFASLSRALDILDVHLESGEILARWDTAVQLRFLLQSARNKEDQMELAEKMVRRQSRGPHSEQRWWALWGDMKKLAGGEDALLRGAFGVLSHQEMIRIYLGGVFASGSG